MPAWNDILKEVSTAGSTLDVVRRQYLGKLFEITKRNVILYYSGWLQKRDVPNVEVNENDKNAFMATIHKLDRTKGLDLVLHTPGGDVAATESLVSYLRSMFGNDIRAIVPEIAMSAGTMMALACKQIIMGKHSSLGPIDPQFNGMSAHGLIEEFKRAHQEMQQDNSKAFVWQPIINKYPPTLVGECEKSILWAEDMVKNWLRTGMFVNDKDADQKITKIINELADHGLTKSHNRHISIDRAKDLGIFVLDLESDQNLQEAVLSIHHSCMLTFDRTPAAKIVDN